MWKTIKKIKKIILLTLNNISNSSINLSDLTLGLNWYNVKSIIGNARLMTFNNEKILTIKYNNSTSNVISIEAYNTKYSEKVNSYKLIDKRQGMTEEMKKGVGIYTLDPIRLTGSYEWRSEGLYAKVTDVEFDVYLDDYLVQRVTVNDWRSVSFTSDWAGTHSFQVFEIIIYPETIDYYYGYNEYHTISFDSYSHYEGYLIDSETDVNIQISYIDTKSKKEKTSTDIHLIAWEEN